MSEHTPGPWRVETRGGMAGREVRAVATYVVATVNTTSNDEGNREANARLIAAAPELLTALREMVKAVDELMTEFISKKRAADWGVINHAGVLAGLAIRKARD